MTKRCSSLILLFWVLWYYSPEEWWWYVDLTPGWASLSVWDTKDECKKAAYPMFYIDITGIEIKCLSEGIEPLPIAQAKERFPY